ncbi:hypothetical protein GCK32_006184 [Trichostrongylus colubriformis]|uniref:Uncharacterized protein n=1 Tax=Trichostrongylus colubriformis TaxID=6319 RepID=A0AAN8IHM6_TRICO
MSGEVHYLLLLCCGRRMAECYLETIERLTDLVWLPVIVVSTTVLTLLICDSKAPRFDDDDPDSAANKAKRAAREKAKREAREEELKRQEGLKKGEFRQMDPNETVNEVASNWGAAAAMAKARGDDQKYFEPPKQVGSDTPITPESGESKESKESREKKQQPAPAPAKFRPRDDNETVNEVVSNWGAAQAMLQKKEGGALPAKSPPPPPPPQAPPPQARPKGPPKGFRAADDNETVNEVVSNWGAAQAMLQKNQPPPKPPPPPPPPPPQPQKPPAAPAGMAKFRPRDDNETVNEVVSNWGAAAAMMQKKQPPPRPPPPPPPPPPQPQRPAAAPPAAAKFRPRDDNETVNEVVSNWGAAAAMLQKKQIPTPQPPQPQRPLPAPAVMPKPATPRPPPQPKPLPRGFRAADDNETVNEVVSNWGAAQAMLQKKPPPPRSSPGPPPAPAVPARPAASRPPPQPKPPPRGFRAADDNETVNEVVSNWGAAQAMMQKKRM